MNTSTAHFFNSTFPFAEKMTRTTYEVEKAKLQVELLKMQRWVRQQQQKIIVLFEGRDAAGKGGSIKRFTEHLNPRFARVVALDVPTAPERGQWYFQRYIRHFPTNGEIVFFDRSWYNRAGVEKVMQFCNEDEYQEFMATVPDLERIWSQSGIRLFKYWFSVTQEEQQKRLAKRADDPLKQWKLSDIDRQAESLWQSYTVAKEQLFQRTNTLENPWVVVKSDDKKRARINCMRHLLLNLPYPDKNHDVVDCVDAMIVCNAANFYA